MSDKTRKNKMTKKASNEDDWTYNPITGCIKYKNAIICRVDSSSFARTMILNMCRQLNEHNDFIACKREICQTLSSLKGFLEGLKDIICLPRGEAEKAMSRAIRNLNQITKLVNILE